MPTQKKRKVSPAQQGTPSSSPQHRPDEKALREWARLAALNADVGVALTQSGSLQDTLHRCTDSLMRHIDSAAFARIWILDNAGKVLELQASSGLYTHLNGPHSRVPMGDSKIGSIAQERHPYCTNTVIGSSDFHDQDWAQREGITAFAGYPLIVEERLIGVVALFAYSPLSEAETNTLACVADTIALGIERKRAETALQQSEEYFRALIENASDIITILNSDGTIRYTSLAVERVLGYRPEDMLGKSIFEIVHPDDALTLIHTFSHIVQSPGGPLSLELRCQRKDSSWCLLEGTGKNLLENPAVAGVVVNIRDSTDRKRAEENIRQAKREWETTLDAVSDLILLTDEAGIIRRCNRAVSHAFKTSYPQLIGLPIREVFYGSSEAVTGSVHDPLLEEILQGGRRQAVQFPQLEGWFTIVRHPVQPSDDNPLQGFVYTLTDMTERKRLEDLLRERIIQPHDIPGHLRKFRKELGLSQKKFGQAFGGYSQRQINSYESGEIEVPIGLLLAIKNGGYTLDVILAPSKPDAIHGALGYLSSSHKSHEILRQLVSAMLHILDQERTATDTIFRQLGIPHKRNFTKERKILQDMLHRTGLSVDIAEDTDVD